MIKRYYATKDNTITNAFRENLSEDGQDANMGASDILEAFSIYGQVESSLGVLSAEEARILIEFDITEIEADITAGELDATAKYYLKLFNAPHGRTLPLNFQLEVVPLEEAWEEGTGMDMEDYRDLTYGKGSSWKQKGAGVAWTTLGGHFPSGTPIMDLSLNSQTQPQLKLVLIIQRCSLLEEPVTSSRSPLSKHAGIPKQQTIGRLYCLENQTISISTMS